VRQGMGGGTGDSHAHTFVSAVLTNLHETHRSCCH
jgi:hypothetical protein